METNNDAGEGRLTQPVRPSCDNCGSPATYRGLHWEAGSVYVCVKADNPEDARHTAIMECTAMEWEEGEAEVIDDYANGEDPKHHEFIERYKLGGEYYETEYNEDVPPSQP